MFDNDKVKGYKDEVDGDCGPVENGDNGYDNEGATVVNNKTAMCNKRRDQFFALILTVLKTNLAQSLVALASELGD